MNNFLLPNTDFFCEPALPFPSNCMPHGTDSSYSTDFIQNNILLGPPHFQETITYMEETSINPSDSCITANSSSNFAIQPSFAGSFLFTPKKDLNFYYENLNPQEPTFVIPPSYYIANNELSLTLGSQLSEPSCSNLSHVTGFESGQLPFHRPNNCSHVKSKYLQVVQQILSEVTSYVLADTACAFNSPSTQPVRSSRGAVSGVDSSEMLGLEEEAGSVTCADVDMEGNFVQQEINASRAELLRMLQLVDNQYNKCLDEIQNIISKFNALTDLHNSRNIVAPFAHLTISSLYKQLRKRITREIVSLPKYNTSKDTTFESSFIKNWASQKDKQLKRTELQIWRPQRGLPEKSVSVLKAWMFQNFLRPYPSDNEKDVLAVKSGLTRSQVSNWFINARVRLWKPMIEEMYAEVYKTKENEEGNSAAGLFV
ncbi:homeobox protein ATH1 [Carex littledalei]|uniref:Homeobox protein ATH1 n=1 Tax=Carex littledalei TaxID=544730 RepID=A0A833REK1_9POAL|nr:homeobox protein ATH1 [Carex littledalei]